MIKLHISNQIDVQFQISEQKLNQMTSKGNKWYNNLSLKYLYYFGSLYNIFM